MPLVQAVCTECGAAIQVNDNHDASICPFCQRPFIVKNAINRYYNANNKNSGGVTSAQINAAMNDIYKNARALIINGACFPEYAVEYYLTSNDNALQALLIKALTIDPCGERMLMLKVANSISAKLRGMMGINYEDIENYLPLLREKDPELYMILLNKTNQRFHKMTNANRHYSGGLLGLKILDFRTRGQIDKFLVPEEGYDLPFLIDYYYCSFWRINDDNPDYNYICQRIFASLPADWQRWFIVEFERRRKIENDILQALYAGKYKMVLDIFASAGEIYPSLKELNKHFIKNGFSYKCTLSTNPNTKALGLYAPDLIHDALNGCPSMVKQLENL